MKEFERERILVFIVTYNPHDHIRSVLDRLPRNIFDHPDFHILVIDDCSKDDTAQTASTHAGQSKFQNITVLQNSMNMGYGGNQKIGFRYAIENGFDVVMLLPGDGQYAPELVFDFVDTWRQRQAAVVLGSRMIQKPQALEGRIPLYKWVGNQVFTRLQNFILESSLSGFHTGYRAYDVGFLKRVPFDLNTNDFHFDTEILLQALALDVRIEEFSIPTYCGDDVRHVNGLRYAWNVLKACSKYRFQTIGFFCSMQYRGLLQHSQRYADKSQYLGSTHYHVLRYVRPSSRVLDLGCGPGHVSNKLKEMGCYVVGIDVEPITHYGGDSFILKDLEQQGLNEDISSYDYILLLDILEHLSDPERFLINCRYSMNSLKWPTVLISTGNVAFIGVRLQLGLGFFNYGERGILDVTHNRLFTLSSFRRLLRETGYELVAVHGIGLPFQLLFDNLFGQILSRLSQWLASIWPSLFAYQFLIEATPIPHSFMLLKNAENLYGGGFQEISKTISPERKRSSSPDTCDDRE